MKQFKVNGFVRVSKRNAKLRYDSGEVIYLCPCKLRPGCPWHPEAAVMKESVDVDSQVFVTGDKDFERIVNEYSHYNCARNVGEYPAYYIKEQWK